MNEIKIIEADYPVAVEGKLQVKGHHFLKNGQKLEVLIDGNVIAEYVVPELKKSSIDLLLTGIEMSKDKITMEDLKEQEEKA